MKPDKRWRFVHACWLVQRLTDYASILKEQNPVQADVGRLSRPATDAGSHLDVAMQGLPLAFKTSLEKALEEKALHKTSYNI